MKIAQPSVRLVACADKIHNIRSLIADYRQVGEAVWERFRANKKETLWFYREVLQSLKDSGENRSIILELEKGVEELSFTIGLATINKGKTSSEKKRRWSRKCPECGSDSVMPIIYGLIEDPEAIQEIKDGEIWAGGCCIDYDSPKWRCRVCEEEFGKID